MTDNPFASAVSGGAGFAVFGPERGPSADDPDWMKSFQATLGEIHEKGFKAYAKEVNDKKLEELRAKILEEMGLTESDLDEMTPESRAAIEKLIATEMRERLTAGHVLEAQAKIRGKEALSTSEAATLAVEAQAAPNGLGAGMTLIRAMEAAREAAPTPDAGQ